ncbi:UNVERIFIED_CONTAM: hypothetical protein GTU68_014239 [Idotea baltica]|nr:hypothetical protein [Idotea baltica]
MTTDYRLQLWDTAGQERFRALIPSYLKDSHCGLIVYDVSDRRSLDHAVGWLDFYRETGYLLSVPWSAIRSTCPHPKRPSSSQGSRARPEARVRTTGFRLRQAKASRIFSEQ